MEISLSALYEYSIRECWAKIRITNNSANGRSTQYVLKNKGLSQILNQLTDLKS
jgi:hypothetical protein